MRFESLIALLPLVVATGMVPASAVAGLEGAPGTLVFVGSSPDAHMGYDAADAGDVNGDGYPDIIVSEHQLLRAVIFFGGSAMDTLPDVVFTNAGVMFGVSVCGAGDVNNDGFADVLVSDMAANNDRGSVYLYLGGTVMDNVPDLVMHGDAEGDYFGYDVAPAGDVNNDGYDDVVVTAPTSDAVGQDAGRAYVYLGGAVPNNIPDVLLFGQSEGDKFGIHAGSAGDQNSDGFDDVLIAAPDRREYLGEVYVFHGGPTMDGAPDRIVPGVNDEGRFGAGLPLRQGDVDGDGFIDLVVGGGEVWTFRGSLYVLLGGPAVDSVPDLIVNGEADGDGFACGANSLATGGDLNADGCDDILVGAPSNRSGGAKAGKAYVFLGGANPDGSADRVWLGAAGDRAGNAVALVADADGNGFDDALVGACDDDPSTPPNRGYALLHLMDTWSITRNPGFEEGTASWTFFTNGGGVFTTMHPGQGSPAAGVVRITSAGTNVQLYQTRLSLEPGARYRLRFAAYSTTGHDLAVSIHKHTAPGTNYGLSNYVVRLSPGWQSHVVEFTAGGFPVPVGDARLRFWLAPFASPGDQYWFDNIFLERIGAATPSVSVVENGGFEGGTVPWKFYTNGTGSFDVTAPGFAGLLAGRVSVVTPGSNTQVYQSGLDLLPNTRYRMSFTASSSAGADLLVALQRHDPPYTNYGLSRVVGLGPGWQAFAFEFRTTGFAGPVNNGRLRFSLVSSPAGDIVAIDRVSLGVTIAREAEEKAVQDAGTPMAFRLHQNHPNPFNPGTTICYEIPCPLHVSLTVYNLLGQHVATLVQGERGAGSHEVVFDAGNLAGGVYVYRLSAGSFVETRKFMLLR